jgi:hypothetical protein
MHALDIPIKATAIPVTFDCASLDGTRRLHAEEFFITEFRISSEQAQPLGR